MFSGTLERPTRGKKMTKIILGLANIVIFFFFYQNLISYQHFSNVHDSGSRSSRLYFRPKVDLVCKIGSIGQW